MDKNGFVIVDGYLVSYKGLMKAIEIPEDVTIICGDAFMNSDIHRIVVGKGVKRIEANAFHCCGSLKEIVLPDKIEIAGEIVNKCNQLKRIFANPDTIGEKYAIERGFAVAPCACLDQEWYISEGKVIKCFLQNEKEIVVPNGVKCIGPRVFENYRKLVSIKMPESVCNIDTKAFRKCISLESVCIPENVLSLGGCAFESCIKLKNIVLPSSLKVIWGNCFNGCTSLEEVIILDGCTTLHGLSFANCKSLKKISIPASVSFIQDNAFLGCSPNLELYVQKGSFALEFAIAKHMNYITI